jgi:UDP-N-acetylglucosamine:LPS N-acetylglucosamine transferase
MMRIVGAFQSHELFFITYHGPRSQELRERYRVYEVVNYRKSRLRFWLSTAKILGVFLRERPAMVVSTGSEIAIPVFYVAWLLRVKTMYIETLTRVNRPSLTGQIVYPIATTFLVQWEELLQRYGKKAQFWGSVL